MGYDWEDGFMREVMGDAVKAGKSYDDIKEIRNAAEQGLLTEDAEYTSPHKLYDTGKVEDATGTYEGLLGELTAGIEKSQELVNAAQADVDALDAGMNQMVSDEFFRLYSEKYLEYENEGMLAKKNAEANAAARTGGYGNSWGRTAGAKTYEEHMKAFGALIPELLQAAGGMWEDKRADAMAALSAVTDSHNALVADSQEALGEAWDIYEPVIREAQNNVLQDVLKNVIAGTDGYTEDAIPEILRRYGVFEEEEIEAASDNILSSVAEYYKKLENQKKADAEFFADLEKELIAHPEYATDSYITNRLVAGGYITSDMSEEEIDALISDVRSNVVVNEDAKKPTHQILEGALEAFAQGDDAYARYKDSYLGYDKKAIDAHVNKHRDRFTVKELTEDATYYIANEKDDTTNFGWGIDHDDVITMKTKDMGGNDVETKMTVKELIEALVDAGMSKKEAKDWVRDEKNVPREYKKTDGDEE